MRLPASAGTTTTEATSAKSTESTAASAAATTAPAAKGSAAAIEIRRLREARMFEIPCLVFKVLKFYIVVVVCVNVVLI